MRRTVVLLVLLSLVLVFCFSACGNSDDQGSVTMESSVIETAVQEGGGTETDNTSTAEPAAETTAAPEAFEAGDVNNADASLYGKVNGNSYQNDALGLTVDLDDSWSVMDPKGSGEDTNIGFMAFQASTQSAIAISVEGVEVKDPDSVKEAYLNKYVDEYSGMQGMTVNEIRDVTISGKTFRAVYEEYTEADSDVKHYKYYIPVWVDDDLECILITSTGEETLANTLSMIKLS